MSNALLHSLDLELTKFELQCYTTLNWCFYNKLIMSIITLVSIYITRLRWLQISLKINCFNINYTILEQENIDNLNINTGTALLLKTIVN